MAQSDILKEFKKEELFQICDELGIEYAAYDMSRNVIERIATDIEENGLPDPLSEDCSELLFNFMYFSGYINDKGEILEIIQKFQEVVVEKIENPPCWGFQDDKDPSCKRCPVAAGCIQVKLETKLACFGKLHNMQDENCQVCLLASYCKVEYQKLFSN